MASAFSGITFTSVVGMILVIAAAIAGLMATIRGICLAVSQIRGDDKEKCKLWRPRGMPSNRTRQGGMGKKEC